MQTLPAVLKAVDWVANIDAAFEDTNILAKLERALFRIAVWSKQLETADRGNSALCFIREMQVAGQQAAALLGLCLYKASAASARTLLETCLYYTYFRTHPEELATLVRVDKYFVTKSELLDYHRNHTRKFMEYQALFGLIGNLERWYSNVSAVVHGQIPGAWSAHSALQDIGFHLEIHTLAAETFISGEELAHQLLLCTAGKQLWTSFSPDAKTVLVKGLPGDKRASLGLDAK
jgi:hypothetical protein